MTYWQITYDVWVEGYIRDNSRYYANRNITLVDYIWQLLLKNNFV